MRLAAILGLACVLFAYRARADDLPQAKRKAAEASALFELRRFEEAARKYEEAFALAPSKRKLLVNVAGAYERDFDARGTRESLERAVHFYERVERGVPELAGQARAALTRLSPQLERLEAQGATGADAAKLAEKRIARSRVADALAIVDRARAQKELPREAVAALERARGQALLARGDRAGASAAFFAMLCLDAGAGLPPEASDGARAALEAARRELAGRSLSLTHVPPGEATAGRAVKLRVDVAQDPASLVRAVRVSFRRTGAFSEVRGTAPEVALPAAFTSTLGAGAAIDYFVDVLGEHDAILQRFGSADVPLRISVRGPTAAAAPTSGPPPETTTTLPAPVAGTAPARASSALRTTSWIVLGAGAATLVAGGIAGVLTLGKQGDLEKTCKTGVCPPEADPDITSYEGLQSKTRVLLIAGAVTTAAGAVLLWISPSSRAPKEAQVRPWIGWGTAGLEGRF